MHLTQFGLAIECVAVDIDLGNDRAAFVLGGERLDGRMERPARRTPLRPEIDEHGLLGLDHLLAEVTIGHGYRVAGGFVHNLDSWVPAVITAASWVDNGRPRSGMPGFKAGIGPRAEIAQRREITANGGSGR